MSSVETFEDITLTSFIVKALFVDYKDIKIL